MDAKKWLEASVLRDNLVRATKLAKKAIGSRTTLPVLSNFLIETRKGRLCVAATDLDLGIAVTIPASIGQDGAITVPARTLHDIAPLYGANDKDNIRLDLLASPVTNTLHLEAGSTTTKFKGIDAYEFPPMPAIDEAQTIIEVDRKALANLLKSVAWAADTKKDTRRTRPQLADVNLTLEEGSLTAVTADRWLLAVDSMPVIYSGETVKVRVFATGANKLAQALGDDDLPDLVKLGICEDGNMIVDAPADSVNADLGISFVLNGNVDILGYDKVIPNRPPTAGLLADTKRVYDLLKRVKKAEALHLTGDGWTGHEKSGSKPFIILDQERLPEIRVVGDLDVIVDGSKLYQMVSKLDKGTKRNRTRMKLAVWNDSIGAPIRTMVQAYGSTLRVYLMPLRQPNADYFWQQIRREQRHMIRLQYAEPIGPEPAPRLSEEDVRDRLAQKTPHILTLLEEGKIGTQEAKALAILDLQPGKYLMDGRCTRIVRHKSNGRLEMHGQQARYRYDYEVTEEGFQEIRYSERSERKDWNVLYRYPKPASKTPEVSQADLPDVNPAAVKRYQERKEARIERYKDRAARNQVESRHRYQTARKMGELIPMGQPILVGHYSEKSDRAYRARIDGHMRKSIEHEKKARYWGRRAKAAENNRAVRSDDPEATHKLAARIARLEEQRDRMKEGNKILRDSKLSDEEKVAAVLALALPDRDTSWALKKNRAGDRYQGFFVSNETANIRRLKQRLADLVQQHTREKDAEDVGDVRIEENAELNSTEIYFPDKPSEAVRDHLKRAGFRWGRQTRSWYKKRRDDYTRQLAREIAQRYHASI